jgi:hypothetical protein
MRTAEHFAVGLNAMADDAAAAMDAHGRQGVNGALEAVEGVYLAVEMNLKRLIIIVAADFTGCHWGFS